MKTRNAIALTALAGIGLGAAAMDRQGIRPFLEPDAAGSQTARHRAPVLNLARF